MRLVTYEADGSWRTGLMGDAGIIDTRSAARQASLPDAGPTGSGWGSNREVIQADEQTREALVEAVAELATSALPLTEIRLGPPVPDPDKLLCMGLNYRDHAEEQGLPLPSAPQFFAKFRNSLIGPADPIVLPGVSEQIDYEAELAVVIGRRCRRVSVEDAMDYVGGAMALNDVSARDLQMEVSQWTMGKAIDTFAPCGPALVTLDEISDIGALGIRARVNGETLQDANTSLLIFGVPEAMAFLSRVMTLEPGDVIATGTPAGVGQARDPQVWLRGGDVVEIELDEIGTLRNPVRSG
jgi:2-keto-4-pentenoate hydratase/2-oxohepta-3-ene-1,7-dioic acid hydratase in catechol pathway